MNTIEEKLDQIIILLTSIEAKLSPQQPGVSVEVIESENKPSKPTKSQLKFKHSMEFACRMDRKYYLSGIRKDVVRIMEIRKKNPDWKLDFDPQCIPHINEKIKTTGVQFYKDLKVHIERYAKTIEAEGEKTLQRAIARLTARA